MFFLRHTLVIINLRDKKIFISDFISFVLTTTGNHDERGRTKEGKWEIMGKEGKEKSSREESARVL